MLGACIASRHYDNGKGNRIGFIGKTTRMGGERAIVNKDGDVYIVVAGKFLVTVTGNGSASDKLAYAQAVDVAKLAKM